MRKLKQCVRVHADSEEQALCCGCVPLLQAGFGRAVHAGLRLQIAAQNRLHAQASLGDSELLSMASSLRLHAQMK